jgi:hypothetical protein
MNKSPRKRKPLREGFLKEIFEILVEPILILKPKSWHIQDWLDSIFSVKERPISRYVSTESFELIRLKKHDKELEFKDKVKTYTVRKHASIWIRMDKDQPNRVDIEIWNGNGSTTEFFQISKRQYKEIFKYLEEKPFKYSKRTIYSWESDQNY